MLDDIDMFQETPAAMDRLYGGCASSFCTLDFDAVDLLSPRSFFGDSSGYVDVSSDPHWNDSSTSSPIERHPTRSLGMTSSSDYDDFLSFVKRSRPTDGLDSICPVGDDQWGLFADDYLTSLPWVSPSDICTERFGSDTGANSTGTDDKDDSGDLEVDVDVVTVESSDPFDRVTPDCSDHSSPLNCQRRRRSTNASHNVMEKQRRNQQRDLFVRLKHELPQLTGKERASKVVILREARLMIEKQEAEEMRLLAEKERLVIARSTLRKAMLSS